MDCVNPRLRLSVSRATPALILLGQPDHKAPGVVPAPYTPVGFLLYKATRAPLACALNRCTPC